MFPTDFSPFIKHFQEEGYVVIPGLFSADEVTRYRDHFMDLRLKGEYAGDFAGINADEYDPLQKYPRMIHMHRWDELSRDWMLEPRLDAAMSALLGESPIAVQTMLYFKPPGARGQALHQDNYYLRVQPGTCIAAWMALDPCDEANGCMSVVPGSHQWPVLCPVGADPSQSFTDVTVPIPPGTPVAPMIMQPGDVLFFNGQIVHGSLPNTTSDRFRRALIGHYIRGDATQVANFYFPALHMDGREVSLNSSSEGGACGVWVNKNGETELELTGEFNVKAKQMLAQ